MNLALKAALAFLVLNSFLWAQKVDVGYDKKADFQQFKSYAWTERQIPTNRPLLVMHINGAIDEELVKKGLQKAAANPDLLVTTSGGIDPQSAFTATDPTYSAYGGVPPPDATAWGGSLPAVANPVVQEGMLVVDLVDAKHKRLVWRAKVKVNLDYQNKEKALEQVNKAIARMFSKYPPAKD